MTNNRFVSDLTTQKDVLNSLKRHAKYVLMDFEDYEKKKATFKLMAFIEESDKSSREESWISMDSIEFALGF